MAPEQAAGHSHEAQAAAVVPNANTVPMAWVGTPAQRPADPALLTMQAALNAAAAGQTVSFDPNDYVFTTRLTVPRQVLLDTASASTLFAQFLVTGGGLATADDVTIGVNIAGVVITVNPAGAALDGITITNPNGVARPVGVQLAATATGVAIDRLRMDGGGQASSVGINLTTGSATIVAPAISGVATGIGITAASTMPGISVTGGSVAATTTGIALGATTSPVVSGVKVSGAGVGTGVDLASSSAATVTSTQVTGFARGIGATAASTAAGPTITNATITQVSNEGIALGSTTGATVTTPSVTGTDATQSIGINLYKAAAVTLDRIQVSHYVSGVVANVAGTGQGPRIVSPLVTDVSLAGITLGSTQGAVITDPVVTGTGVSGSTGINAVNAGQVTVSNATLNGFGYGIGSQSSIPAGSAPRADYVLTDIDVTGVPDASTGIYLLGTTNARITNVDADVTGPGVVVHQSSGTRVAHLRVTGHEGLSATSGSSIFRGYDSIDLAVDDSSIRAGSYGFYFSSTDDVTITDARVANVGEYAVFGRTVGGVDVSDSVFKDNGGAGLFSFHASSGGGPSHGITLRGNTMTDNTVGVNLNAGTRDVTFTRNVVAGQRYAVSAAPAHDVTIARNSIRQADSEPGDAAIMVRPLYEDAADPGSYSSSGIEVRDNVFRGGGKWIKVGTPDDSSADADRRTLRDPVLVVGNTFPADSVAIRTFPNAVSGKDRAARIAIFEMLVRKPVAVDARNYDDPNDWDAPCLATGRLDGELVYDGGGARVDELTDAEVLYPTDCIALSLTERVNLSLTTGDTLTWNLYPRNDGLRSAPAGWSVTQVLPRGVDLLSMTGDGYEFDGLTATATKRLGVHDTGPTIRMSVRITASPAREILMKDVAYVAPLAPEDSKDLDGDGYVDVIDERPGPLVVPDLDTDTDESETDNDAQGFWAVTASGKVVPLPPSTDPPAGAPHPHDGVWVASTSGTSGLSGGQTTSPTDGVLPGTGAPAGIRIWVLLGAALICAGALVTALGRRTRRL